MSRFLFCTSLACAAIKAQCVFPPTGKYQQFNRRRLLVIGFGPTPTSKTCIISYPLQELQIIGMRCSKPHPKLCSHGRVLQHQMIINIHTPPLALFWFHDMQFRIRRIFASINTSWRPGLFNSRRFDTSRKRLTDARYYI